VGTDGRLEVPSVATGTGPTRDAARDAALALTEDAAIRAALASSDSTRPYWVQGALGQQQEAQRKAAALEAPARRRLRR
jgi:hypothetical protein